MNYRVDGTDVVLSGTVHMVPRGVTLPLDGYLKLVVDADEVIFESDLDHPPVAGCRILESGSAAEALGDELYTRLVTLAHKTGVAEPLDRLKPWCIGMILGVFIPIQSGATLAGVDRRLWDLAKSKGKRISLLEGVELFQAFDLAPQSEHIAALRYLVDHPEAPVAQLAAVYSGWCKSDQDALDVAFQGMAKMMPTFYRNLFEVRNRLWIESVLLAIRNQKRALFAIGCGHIAHGSASMRRLLEEHGYTLSPIKRDGLR